jgi:hypothetical protein
MLGTFIAILALLVAACGWLGLGAWALISVFQLIDPDDPAKRPWRRTGSVVAGFLVATAVGITIITAITEDSCPTGTSREYKSTGYKQGYHYCLAQGRP